MRVLLKGGSISGLGHDEAAWEEPANIKDYDTVILNLNRIVQRADELATPDSNIPQSVEFPSSEDVVKLLQGGNTLYIFLPKTRATNLRRVEDGATTEAEVDLLSWLPFHLDTVEEPGKSGAPARKNAVRRQDPCCSKC